MFINEIFQTKIEFTINNKKIILDDDIIHDIKISIANYYENDYNDIEFENGAFITEIDKIHFDDNEFAKNIEHDLINTVKYWYNKQLTRNHLKKLNKILIQ